MRTITITPSVFHLAPSFMRGIIVVTGMQNTLSDKRVKKPLSAVIETLLGQNKETDHRCTAWDEIHRAFGSNPEEFKPSIKSLLQRVEKGGGLPFINTAVGITNYISLKHLLSCGAEDITKVKGNLRVDVATGKETSILIGSETPESPQVGEVIYVADDNNVLCRRMNWRTCEVGKITQSTTQMVVNVDALHPTSKQEVIEARDELAELLKKHVGATLQVDFLDLQNPHTSINI